VFEDIRPLIQSVTDGYNVAICAYGQTASGKTYTMTGPPETPGVNSRALKELFELCKARDEIVYTLRVRY
jgi:kinesin family protein C2/C3